MTGPAGDGYRCGPPDRRGLAWLIDLAAAGSPEPGRGSSWTSAAAAPAETGLALESFYPADQTTAETLPERAR